MFPSRSLLYAASFSCLVSAATSCAPSGAFVGRAVEPREESVVSVTNHNWSDLTVYALRGSTRFRLGSVTSFTTTRFRLPKTVMSATDLRMHVEVIGSSESHTTEVLQLGYGDRMEWVISSYLPMSHYSIR